MRVITFDTMFGERTIRDMVIRKKIMEKERPFIGKDIVKVITGIRRCGKSVFMSQIRDATLLQIDKGAPVFYLDS